MNIIELLQQIFNATEEQTTSFTEAMKANKIYTASEENMDIRYGKLKTDHESQGKQLAEAMATIESLKKDTKGQEAAQQKIAAYETQMQQLQAELEQTKLDAAIKVELLSSKAKDVDYLTFKLREKLKADNETLSLDDNGSIKGWADKLEGLKTQFPTMFEDAGEGSGDGYQVLDPNKLQKGKDGPITTTKAQFLAMNYEERLALKQKNETLYKQLAK